MTILESVQRILNFLSEPEVQWKPSTQSTYSSPQSKRTLYLDWSDNPWVCDCGVVSFIGWLIKEGNWLADVNGYCDVICHEQLKHGLTRREVYFERKINRTTLSFLVKQCKIGDIASSKMTSRLYDVINSTVSTSAYENLSLADRAKNFSRQFNHLDSTRNALPPHLAVVIAVAVTADALAYVMIVLFVKKRHICSRKISKVTPY